MYRKWTLVLGHPLWNETYVVFDRHEFRTNYNETCQPIPLFYCQTDCGGWYLMCVHYCVIFKTELKMELNAINCLIQIARLKQNCVSDRLYSKESATSYIQIKGRKSYRPEWTYKHFQTGQIIQFDILKLLNIKYCSHNNIPM